MSRKGIIWAISVVAVLIGMLVLFAMRDAKAMSCGEIAESNIASIAGFVEAYKDEHGNYPAKLEDLSGNDSPAREFITPLLDPKSDIRYGYVQLNGGFLISATNSGGLFSKRMYIEKQFKSGEALQRFERRPK